MKENKKVSPSLGVCGRNGAATLTNFKRHLAFLSVLFCMLLLTSNAWAGQTWIEASSKDVTNGLVYASTGTSNPSVDQYTSPSTSGIQSSYSHAEKTFYIWAKPARGYRFSAWTEVGGQGQAPKSSTGERDQMVGVPPTIQSVASTVKATFASLTAYNVTYEQPVGGSYSVHYEYYSVNTSTNKFFLDGQTQQLTPTSGNWKPEDDKTYETDSITLSTENTNFIGWYKNGEFLSDANPYTEYHAKANDVISAQFKEIGWGEVTGDLAVNVTAKGTYEGKKIYIACPTLIGSWSSADFSISPKVAGDANDASNEYGSIEFGAITLNTTESRLEIPYTYVASEWGGISVDVTVTPAYGEAKQFTIAAYAEEKVNYEACIEENGERTHTGDLTYMLDLANGMDNKPTVKLMNPVTITAPLSFTNSFTFDVNGKVLTANCASAFSIAAAGIDVKIIDGSFTQVGEIHTSASSSNPVSVVSFTQKAKLTMHGGALSAENTGAGGAYGVSVSNGSIFYMTGGNLTVTATTGNAQGVHVATESDYATFNGGSLTVSAPTSAYGLWSAGQSNITDATISVETTTGTNAYGSYINGGTSTLNNNMITANAKTTNAYGAYVNAGRLNTNGGSFAATAVTDKVYGVYVAAGATAMLQQKATVTAEIITGNGSSNVEVCGVNNLGTVSLYNISVTATSATNYATAVNTKTSAVSTTIEGGTYIAQTGTHNAFGVNHQCGTINVDGGTFKAISETNSATGFRAGADGTIANATISAESTTSETAFGLSGATAEKNITVSNCIIKAKAATTQAYAIYSRANMTAENCSLDAKTVSGANARGFYAEQGTNTLVNCNATVSSNTVRASGVYHDAGSMTIQGGVYEVEAKQSTATAAQTAELYGVFNAASQTTIVDGATFRVSAPNNTWSQLAHAAYINGVLNSTNATYEATGRTYVYAVYGLGSSTLNLSGNTISANVTSGTKSYGIYAKKNFTIKGDIVSAVGPTTDIYAMFFDATNSVGDVLAGKFSAQGNGTNNYGALNASGTTGKVKLKGGVYKTTFNLEKYTYTGYKIYHLDGTHPDYADGYRYTIATENPSPYVCRIVNGAYYSTLEAAMQYTLDNSGNYTIVMTQSYTLPAGDYTLPANATLVIPYKFGQNAITTQSSNPAEPDTRTTVGLKENFLCLTLANGANINVDGKIGVGAEMYCTQSSNTAYINGPYGQIKMETGSHIQLNSGAYLYAWGMITGTGTIAVKNNAEVREMFRLSDMKDPSNLKDYYINNSQDYFPVTQYSIQNIEVPTTYYYNSRLYGAMLCYYSGLGGIYYGEKNIKLVGTSSALFQVTTDDESSWVRKSYKSSSQVWDINSSAQLGSISMTIDIMGVISTTFNSADYILPITHTMKIHVLDGDFEITHNSELLPGASIEVDKTASLTVAEGQNVYIFDNDQWPSTTTRADAAINVHGNINLNGALYTTRSLEDGTNTTYGANIYSTNADAGTVSFGTNVPTTQASIDLITGIDSEKKQKIIKTVTMDPALLTNGTGASQSYTPTSGTLADHSFAYMNNEWTQTYTNGCFEVVGDKVYAKPSDYVQLKNTVMGDDGLEGVEEENHTYLTVDDKLLILMLGCQWWEVEKVEGSTNPEVFECKKPGYEGFYYYDDSDPDVWPWKLKTVNVKFYSAEEGDNVLKTIVTDYNGIPDQSVIPSNPTKETSDEYTYQFYGWKSSETGTTYKWTDPLEVATANMSYRPVFTKTKRNYTVTFVNANNGASVPVETPYGEHPTCTPVMDATAQYTYYFLNWTDASSNTYAIDDELPAVTGATSYTAHWAQVVNKYTITWKNGDEVLETDTKQEYGAAVSYSGANPTKEMDSNYKYEFDGWSLTDGGAKLTSLPTVSGDMTFYAHYIMTPRYAITFANYDGGQLQKESVTAGEHPTYNGLTPARVRDYDGYYNFTGWKNTDGDFFAKDAELPVVTGKETYTAQYNYVTELYLITLNNVDGNGASWEGKFGVGSTPFYAPDPLNPDVPVEPSKADGMEEDLLYEYTFSGWDPELEEVSATSTKEFTAQFAKEVKKYFITFANLDGNGAKDSVEVAYGSTPACPVTPTKADACNTFAFDHWAPAIQSVTGRTTYTAVFSETPDTRTFAITFDGDNDVVVVMDVECGAKPSPATPEKEDAAFYYTFTGWSDGEHVYATADLPVASAEVTYTAQYTLTLRSYTVRFVNYDGTEELQSSTMAYGATPAYSGETPTKPADMEVMKAYIFSGWSPTIATVSGEVTYTAQYNPIDVFATVTNEEGTETTPYSNWSDALAAANSNSGSTLKLYKNPSTFENTYITISGNMTIDLNGHTITGTCNSTSNTVLFYVNNAALTVEDTHGGGVITYTGTTANDNNNNLLYITMYVTGNSGKLTLKKGIIKAAATGRYESCWWFWCDYYYSSANAVYLNSSNTSAPQLDMQGGELLATETYNDGNSKGYAVYFANSSYGHADVSAGKLNAKTAIFQNGAAARTTLTGGYYNMDVSSFCAAPYYDFSTSSEERAVVGSAYTHKVAEAYNITFNNWNGTALSTLQKQIVGTNPAYTGATPTKEPQSLYTFIGWKNTDDDFFAQDATLPAVTAAETYTAQFEEVETFDIDDNAPITEDAEVVTTTIHTDGTLDIQGDAILTTTNLILEATSNASGQLIANANTNINVTGHVYFDWTMNGTTGSVRRTWYAVAVPWEVDARTGITDKATGRTLTAGRDFDLIYYNGATRASEGNVASCWEYVQWDIQGHDRQGNQRPVDNLLHPGRLYMMYFAAEGLQTVRFEKAAGADVMYMGSLNVNAYPVGAGKADTEGGWNGIANPRTYFASLSAGSATYAQVLNNGNLDDYFAGESSPVYQTINLGASKFMVGKPIFLQATGNDPVVVTKQTIAGIVNAAPRRNREESATPEGIDAVYQLTIAAEGKPSSDNLFVQVAEDEKADKYVIGKDLSKGGVAAKRAQMWVDRYNTKLSVNTQMLVNDEATYPLVLFAPAAGEYTISTVQSAMSNEDYDLYLTLNGEAIWNLSNGDYTLSLPQGNTADYGLRISARKSQQTTTGIDEAVVDAQGKTQKVLIEDHVYIIRGNNVYSVDGQLVK